MFILGTRASRSDCAVLPRVMGSSVRVVGIAVEAGGVAGVVDDDLVSAVGCADGGERHRILRDSNGRHQWICSAVVYVYE